MKINHGNFEAKMLLSHYAIENVNWWIVNLPFASEDLVLDAPSYVLSTDDKTGGRWSLQESESHINILELNAVLLGLQALIKGDKLHLLVKVDNSTTVAYINHMGGTKSPSCHEVAKRIWFWCIDKQIYLTATHVPGALNVEADEKSRIFNDRTEWSLCPQVFEIIMNHFSGEITCDIDLFASRLNHKIATYVSWVPDPGAIEVDAFTFNWKGLYVYAFPPFSVILKMLRKMRRDGARGVVIVPEWRHQIWFSLLMDMMVAPPLRLNWRGTLITLPHTDIHHPMGKNLHLMACLL